MIVETFPIGPLQCNCTILADETTKEAIVIDGGDGVDDVLARLSANGLRATLLVHTHAHIDHIYDVGRLREQTNARALLHPGDLPLYRELPNQARAFGLWENARVVDLDGDLRDGDVLAAGALRAEVLHTPGHTPGSVCFAASAGEETVLITGDPGHPRTRRAHDDRTRADNQSLSVIPCPQRRAYSMRRSADLISRRPPTSPGERRTHRRRSSM